MPSLRLKRIFVLKLVKVAFCEVTNNILIQRNKVDNTEKEIKEN